MAGLQLKYVDTMKVTAFLAIPVLLKLKWNWWNLYWYTSDYYYNLTSKNCTSSWSICQLIICKDSIKHNILSVSQKRLIMYTKYNMQNKVNLSAWLTKNLCYIHKRSSVISSEEHKGCVVFSIISLQYTYTFRRWSCFNTHLSKMWIPERTLSALWSCRIMSRWRRQRTG